jgi:very-short-patch-repair endonuclease
MPRWVDPELRRRAKEMRSTQTSLEEALWRELRAKPLDGWKFRRQVPINRSIVDFVCFEARLVVEVDGPMHETHDQRIVDARRDATLFNDGFRVLRFDQDAVLGDLARVVAEIQRNLSRTPSPTPRASARGTLSRNGRG